MFCDSKSAVAMSFDPIAFKNTKHILRAANFMRDLVARNVILMKHVAGSLMIADILTKAPARAVFHQLLGLIKEMSSPSHWPTSPDLMDCSVDAHLCILPASLPLDGG